MNITKPLVSFDIETTSAKIHEARIVEISTLKIWPDGRSEKKCWLINPEAPIEPKATEVHGFTNEMMSGKPTFKEVAIQIYNVFADAGHIVTYNGNRFDIPILYRQLSEVGINWDPRKSDMIDVYKIVAKLNPRTLEAIVLKYLGVDHTDAHSADADTVATTRLLHRLMSLHSEIPKEPSEVAKWADDGKESLDLMGVFHYNEDNHIAFSNGKHKDEVVSLEKHRSYLEWILKANNPPFLPDAIEIVNKFLNSNNK